MKRHSVKAGAAEAPELWVGVNFWSRSGGPRMWVNYDPELVREELTTMRDHGMTVTRSFLYWPDTMPTPDALDEHGHGSTVEDFLDAHTELGMTTIPTFLVGHMSGENWDPAWREGRDIFEDVWFVARQAFYVRQRRRTRRRARRDPGVAADQRDPDLRALGDRRGRARPPHP